MYAIDRAAPAQLLPAAAYIPRTKALDYWSQAVRCGAHEGLRAGTVRRQAYCSDGRYCILYYAVSATDLNCANRRVL
jgi:hypothetical protein